MVFTAIYHFVLFDTFKNVLQLIGGSVTLFENNQLELQMISKQFLVSVSFVGVLKKDFFFVQSLRSWIKLKLSANSLPIRHLPIRPAEAVCQFELKFSSGN